MARTSGGLKLFYLFSHIGFICVCFLTSSQLYIHHLNHHHHHLRTNDGTVITIITFYLISNACDKAKNKIRRQEQQSTQQKNQIVWGALVIHDKNSTAKNAKSNRAQKIIEFQRLKSRESSVRHH
jgi:hypothetical protein